MKEMLAKRSLPRTLKDVDKAALKREKLLETGELSLPSKVGKLSIVVSTAPDFKSRLTSEEQRYYFLEEAEIIKEQRAGQYGGIVIRPRAVSNDIKIEFADNEVSDIIFIGHGSIGAIWADGNGGKFDWRQVSKATTHLKQGKIEQRMCGNFPLDYDVPLGTFAVESLRNIIAAPNIAVPDAHPPDSLFQEIFNDTDGVRYQINALNERYGSEPPVRVD